jgi:hypothetical protein
MYDSAPVRVRLYCWLPPFCPTTVCPSVLAERLKSAVALSHPLPGRPSGYPPGPPQIRTWTINSYGSSVLISQKPSRSHPTWRITFATPQVVTTPTCSAIHWSSVDTVGELKVSPVFPTSRTLCPASPSLQWVLWVSVPHLPNLDTYQGHRYYAPLRLPVALLVSLRSSLALRYLVVSLSVCLPPCGGSLISAGTTLSAPGLLVIRYSSSSGISPQGDYWLSQVPELPP